MNKELIKDVERLRKSIEDHISEFEEKHGFQIVRIDVYRYTDGIFHINPSLNLPAR